MPSTMSLLIALTLLNIRALSVPTSQKCPPTEILTLDPGSRLELECGSSCSAETGRAQYEWTKVAAMSRQKRIQLECRDLVLLVESVGYKDEGVYTCRCLPDGHDCDQALYVTPTLEFVASSKQVRAGESVELSCTTRMANPDFPEVRALTGERLPSHNIDEVLIDDYTYKTEMWLYTQKELKKDYLCTVEYYVEEEVKKLEKNITIYSYTPPEILYTVEHSIKGEEEFGRQAKVGCTVLSSPDTGSRVVWSFKGEELSPDAEKYSMLHIVKDPQENDVVEYSLLVNNLQEADIGPYTCQLHSDFHQEDKNEAWIRREEDKSQNKEDEGNKSSGLFYYVVCLGGVVAVVLVVLRRRGEKGGRSFASGIPSPLPTHSTMERILGKSNRKQK